MSGPDLERERDSAAEAEDIRDEDASPAVSAGEAAESAESAETDESAETAEKPAKRGGPETLYHYIARIGIVLFIITAGVALLLGVIFELTRDTIAGLALLREMEALTAVMPEADDFTPIATADLDGINGAYAATRDGERIGICVRVSPQGFAAAIPIVVGIDMDGLVCGVRQTDTASETPGIGTRALDAAYLDGYAGKRSPLALVRGEAGTETEIAAVTGATVTSTALKDGVQQALMAFEVLKLR